MSRRMGLKRFILSLLILALTSPFAHGMVNGTPVTSADPLSKFLVYIPLNLSLCTGVLIEGKFILTAGHCLEDRIYKAYLLANSTEKFITTADFATKGLVLNFDKRILHPLAIQKASISYVLALGEQVQQKRSDIVDSFSYDLGFFSLSPESVERLASLGIKGISFEQLELTQSSASFAKNLKSYGFGTSEKFKDLFTESPILHTKLIQPTSEASSSQSGVYLYNTDQGIRGGDSGGPVFSAENHLVALNVGGGTNDIAVVDKSYFTHFKSPENSHFLQSVFQNSEEFYKKQCDQIQENIDQSMKNLNESVSQKNIENLYSSCGFYKQLCYNGSMITRHPVLGPCQRVQSQHHKEFIRFLKK